MGKQNKVSTSRWSIAIVLTLGTLFLNACTMHKASKSLVDTDAYVTKTDLQGKTFHLVRGIEEADSDNTVEATPGYSQDFGLVKAEITEHELRFVSDFDPSGRTETAKILASYPITKHFDIIADTNDYNEKTNKIVEDTTMPWDKRAYMRVDWANPSNTLSDYQSQLDGDQLTEKNTVLKEDPKIESGHISFLSEVSIEGKSLVRYLPPFGEDLSSGYRVTFRTHLLPVKQTDYKPVPFNLKDFSRFGYFVTQQDYIDPEHGLRDDSEKIYAQTFNVCEPGTGRTCSTNQISWVLSKGFPEEYKPAARAAVVAWNKTFQESLSRTDNVVVLDESVQADISDPTHNIIAYYDARSGSGLLGVAMGVVNPRTGEKVSARATIYGDGIRYEQGRIEDMINMLSSKDALTDFFGTDAVPQSAPLENFRFDPSFKAADSQRASQMMRKSMKGKARSKALPEATFSDLVKVGGTRLVGVNAPVSAGAPAFLKGKQMVGARLQSLISSNPQLFHIPDVDLLADSNPSSSGTTQIPLKNFNDLGGLEKFWMLGETRRTERKSLVRQSLKGLEGTDFVDAATVRFLLREAGKINDPASLKSQMNDLKKRLSLQIFYTTLLHEMGHTFGLRHNFMGSADKSNYYPEYASMKARLKKGEAGLSDDDLVPFASSSIMDYMDFIEQQGGLGRYDKAAIKYGYRRDLDRENDAITKRGFLFCTDEQILEDLRCQRFDRGSTVSEITSNAIKTYRMNWVGSHVRRGRANFEAIGRNHIGFEVQNTFLPIRMVFDELLYTWITNQRSPIAAGPGQSKLSMVRTSIDNGEMIDIYDPVAAKAAGVDLNDMSTLINAAFDHKTGHPLVTNPGDYTPYDFADLLRATEMAKQFFGSVLGAPEPGFYLVNVDSTGVNGSLASLSNSSSPKAVLASAQASLQNFAEQNVPSESRSQFVSDNLKNVVEIPLGFYGQPYNSQWQNVGGHPQLQVIGSLQDKVAALITLGINDLGVEKYDELGLSSNPYMNWFTKSYALDLVDSLMVNQSPTLAPPRKLSLADGRTIMAQVPATLDANTQMQSVLMALSQWTNINDMSLQDKLAICSSADSSCANPTGADVVDVVNAAGNTTYRAVQTPQGDSIAFDILLSMKDQSESRTKMMKLLQNADQEHKTNLAALQAAQSIADRLTKNLQANTSLAGLVPVVAPAADATSAKGWSAILQLAQQEVAAPSDVDPTALIPALKELISARDVAVKQLNGAPLPACAAPTVAPEGAVSVPVPAAVCSNEFALQTVIGPTALAVDLTQLTRIAAQFITNESSLQGGPAQIKSLTDSQASSEIVVQFTRNVMALLRQF